MISSVEDFRPQEPAQLDPQYAPNNPEDYRERLRLAEEHLRMVVDGARDYAIFMIDPDGIILTWNQGAERMKQWRTEEILGQHFRILYRPEDREAKRPERNLTLAREMGVHEETYPRMKKDGTIFFADVTIHAIRDEATGTLRGFSKVVRDATERQLLLQRLVTVQENERRRISRELHDETGQHLTTLSLGLKALEPSVLAYCATDPEVMAMFLRLRNIAKDLARDLHRVAVELRPTALDDLGLIPALYGYIERWSEGTDIPAEFDTFGLSDFNDGAHRFSQLVETTIYRVVQEALTNIAKYAIEGPQRASRVGVTLQRFDHRLQVTVEDDGAGFDVESAQQVGRLGIGGMRERAAACGGTLEIESTPGEGTTIFLRIPAEFL